MSVGYERKTTRELAGGYDRTKKLPMHRHQLQSAGSLSPVRTLPSLVPCATFATFQHSDQLVALGGGTRFCDLQFTFSL